jgi:hypothetical protein
MYKTFVQDSFYPASIDRDSIEVGAENPVGVHLKIYDYFGKKTQTPY